MKLVELSSAIHIHYKRIARFEESAAVPDAFELAAICQYFGVSLDSVVLNPLVPEMHHNVSVNSIFNRNLKFLLRNRNITRLELSKILSVNLKIINRWLYFYDLPDEATIIKIENIFGIPQSSILYHSLTNI